MEKFLKNLLKKIKLNEPTISTILGGLVILTVGILIFNYFKTEQKETSEDVSLEETEETQLEGFEEIIFKGEEGTYTIQEGDDLWKISEKFYQDGYKWIEIAELNNLAYPDYLAVGQELKMPKPSQKTEEASGETIEEEAIVIEETAEDQKTITEDKYTVQEGDCLWEICIKAYGDGYKWTEVAQTNNLAYPDYLAVGQELKMPR